MRLHGDGRDGAGPGRCLELLLEELMRFILATAQQQSSPVTPCALRILASARGVLSHAPRAGLKQTKKTSVTHASPCAACSMFDDTWLLWESVRPLPVLTSHPAQVSYKVLACLLLSLPANWPTAASQANSCQDDQMRTQRQKHFN